MLPLLLLLLEGAARRAHLLLLEGARGARRVDRQRCDAEHFCAVARGGVQAEAPAFQGSDLLWTFAVLAFNTSKINA